MCLCIGLRALQHSPTTLPLLHEDGGMLQELRAAQILAFVPEITWSVAGVRLLEIYR